MRASTWAATWLAVALATGGGTWPASGDQGAPRDAARPDPGGPLGENLPISAARILYDESTSTPSGAAPCTAQTDSLAAELNRGNEPLAASLPEPATGFLLITGAALLWVRRRRHESAART